MRQGDNLTVNGTKTWISNGIEGTCFAVLVKTDTEAEPRHKGMSLLLAEKGHGFTVGRKLEKIGYKGIDTAELIFENFQVSEDNLIGGEEGRGFHQAVGGLELGRINVAARGVGIANAALKEATAYSQVRETMGKPICQHQAIQLKLADMATRCQAAKLLTEYAATAYDRGERCDMEAGMAKLYASEAALEECPRSACESTAATATRRNFPWSAFTATRRSSASGRAPTRCSGIIIARQLIARNPA